MAEREKFYTIKVIGDSETLKKVGAIEKEIKALTAETESLTKAQGDNTAAIGKNLAQLKLLRKEKSDLLKETTQQTQANKLEEGSLLALRAQLSKDTAAYDSLGKAKRESAQGKELEASIAAQVSALNKLEQATGRYGRQVGNYNTAGVAMSQVLREIPAFTFSAQTGILALSNNIPILVDEMKRLSTSIDITTGKSKGWKGAFLEMGKNLLSFGSIMTIALGLFTIFSDKIFSFISGEKKATKAIKDHKTAQDELNQSMNNYLSLMTNGFQPLQEVLQTLRNGTKNATVSMSELRNALSATKKQLDDLKQTKNVLAGVWVSGPEDKKLYEKRKADLLSNLQLIQDEIDKREAKANEKLLGRKSKSADDLAKMQKEIDDAILAAQNEINEALIDLINEPYIKSIALENEAYRIKLQKYNKRKQEEPYLEDEINKLIELATIQHFHNMKQIRDDAERESEKNASEARRKRLDSVNSSLDDYEKAHEQSNKNIEDKEKETQKQIQAIQDNSYKVQQAAIDSFFQMKEDKIDRDLKRTQRVLDANAETENQILKNRLDKGLDTEIQYAEKKAALDKETQDKKNKADKEAFEKKKKLSKAQIAIDTATTIAKGYADYGYVYGTIAGLAVTAIGAAQLAAVDAQEFAEGGKVMPDRKNIPTKRNGDNVLTTLAVGEVVLNKQQQAALGGDSTFAAIGVAGFNSPNPALSGGSQAIGINKKDLLAMGAVIVKGINNKKVINLESESKLTRDRVANYESERVW